MLLAALIMRHSLLGLLLALASTVPSAFALWLGTQEEGQKTHAIALVLLLGGLALALIIFLGWLF